MRPYIAGHLVSRDESGFGIRYGQAVGSFLSIATHELIVEKPTSPPLSPGLKKTIFSIGIRLMGVWVSRLVLGREVIEMDSG
jgi:hypothetical protein